MIDHKLDFSGLLDISHDMELLSKAENKKVLRDGTRAAAEVLKTAIVERAPERTGKLKRNVVVVTMRGRRNAITSGVHIRGINPDTGNSDNKMKAGNPKNAFYWRFVELGTSSAPPHPFVRPAFDASQDEAFRVAIEKMNAAIDEVLAR
ncbi:hypothetical protein C2U55_25020 [Enterobacteriaceae bacterium ENNIH3]|nr:hypothetical protein C2U55_25020 [Enterobacteriaceae bacterium ENNIH3]AUV07847.1 hypothetical protein C2U52_17085 [Enterobacteriaceae bacterium ENNIH2]